MFWLIMWYLSGFLGCVVGLYSDLKNGKDLVLFDALKIFILSAFGPLLLLNGICYYLSNINCGDKVLIKGFRNEESKED